MTNQFQDALEVIDVLRTVNDALNVEISQVKDRLVAAEMNERESRADAARSDVTISQLTAELAYTREQLTEFM